MTRAYEIRVAGVMGPAARASLSGFTIDVEPATGEHPRSTVVSGQMDPAALHDVLDHLRAFGLELVEIRHRRTLPGPAFSQGPPSPFPDEARTPTGTHIGDSPRTLAAHGNRSSDGRSRMSKPKAHDPTPSVRDRVEVVVRTSVPGSAHAGALAVPVVQGSGPVDDLGVSAAALAAAGFTGARGQTLVVPAGEGPVRVAVGVGTAQDVDIALVRDLAAAFARAVPHHTALAVEMPPPGLALSDADFALAVTQGVLLSRWRFTVANSPEPALTSLILVTSEARSEATREGARRGQVIADAYNIGRDLANCPAATLTAARMAQVATDLAGAAGLEVEVFDEPQLVEMGCGGILGVNMGSVDEPRLIKIRYAPDTPTGRLAMVGKGIMYDSGGISLKPSDESHAQMKNDMTGAASILGAMTALKALGCTTAVTAYLCCTDNMPSGSAMKLGDVLTMRNGTTVEVLNTDAEGRLVMADGLCLATEEAVDAVIDIATLTGACLRTFGVDIAGVMGNNADLVGQVKACGDAVDEPVWELPLHQPYRKQLDSPIADMTNMGGPNAGSITAGLFLQEFVDGHPWAHIDIASTAQLPAPRGWRNEGATGAGGMLLIDLALTFSPPTRPGTDAP